ncbi:putative GATA transcription factor 22 [Andrographis paniculata]|uniref:putative GATA transcription factor 22 n=1 Tax=Andrographis paniculata TaxID=175694 RepID=UPI0021E8DB59|nr:putative GATA transcription factor 22 [Andrographis paniculata]
MSFDSFPKPNPNFSQNDRAPSSFSFHGFFQEHAGCYDHPRFFHPPDDESSTRKIQNKIDNSLKITLWKKEDQDEQDRTLSEKKNPGDWIPSKIKNPTDWVAVKIIANDQNSSLCSETEAFGCGHHSSSNNSPIRVCSDCNTTKTPLWRSGPKGPKSLCNACGIRQRKARQAMAAGAPATNSKLQQHKEKTGRTGHRHSLPVKKRCRTSSGVDSGKNCKKKTCFEDLLINLKKKLGIHRVFPEEEKDAAILLMALSYG